jgi:hypothetical protein
MNHEGREETASGDKIAKIPFEFLRGLVGFTTLRVLRG